MEIGIKDGLISSEYIPDSVVVGRGRRGEVSIHFSNTADHTGVWIDVIAARELARALTSLLDGTEHPPGDYAGKSRGADWNA
jgi:hypothetical protein